MTRTSSWRARARFVESPPVEPPRPKLSEQSLLDFLHGTGLPLVSRLGAVVRNVAIGLTGASVGYAVVALLLLPDGLWNPALPWSGALPALVVAPIYFVAWRKARGQRVQGAALALFVALFTFSALASWPRGAFNVAWYVQPMLALLATTCLGIVPGLLLTLGAVVVLLAASQFGLEAAAAAGGLPDLWIHSVCLAALTLASALTGALMHKVLLAALEAVEQQRRKNADVERALRYRERLLRHAMRVDTVGDLAGLVTHQLRNAYQVMMGHAALAADGDADDAMQRLALVGETLQQSRPLLDQLMSLAHPDDGDPEPGDLNALAAAFCERARRVLPKTIAVEFVACDKPLPVRISQRGLEHSLWNLAINARHAMPDGGALSLTAGLQDGLAFLAVADTGCGIPVELQQRIFDPYFTTKAPGEGTGLGLSLSYGIVKQLGGSIDLKSRVGEGTEVTIALPK